MTFDQLYNAIKSYAEANNLTPAQLAKATQKQVITALELTGDDRSQLLRSWNSLRRRVYDAWKEEAEDGTFQAFIADKQTAILNRFPLATFSREGEGRFVVDIYGGQA